MSFLPPLPAELKWAVVDHLDEPATRIRHTHDSFDDAPLTRRRPGSLETLKALSLTCKEARILTTPNIFSEYDIFPLLSRQFKDSTELQDPARERCALTAMQFYLKSWPSQYSTHVRRLVLSPDLLLYYDERTSDAIDLGLEAVREVVEAGKPHTLVFTPNPGMTLPYYDDIKLRLLVSLVSITKLVSDVGVFNTVSTGFEKGIDMNQFRWQTLDLWICNDDEWLSIVEKWLKIPRHVNLSLFFIEALPLSFPRSFNIQHLHSLLVGEADEDLIASIDFDELLNLLQHADNLRVLVLRSVSLRWAGYSNDASQIEANQAAELTISHPRVPFLPALERLRVMFAPRISEVLDASTEPVLQFFSESPKLKRLELATLPFDLRLHGSLAASYFARCASTRQKRPVWPSLSQVIIHHMFDRKPQNVRPLFHDIPGVEFLQTKAEDGFMHPVPL